jgi:nucleotide-binding universal stress UspA family protein
MNKIKSILVPIDFSAGSRAAFDYAVGLAGKLGARLTALHVAPDFVTYEPLPAFPAAVSLDPTRQLKIQDDVRAFVTPAGSEQPLAEIVVRQGDPADEILSQAATSAADLIVLGTHGRRGFEHWILGSVTEHVARKADRSVLAVPEAAKSAAFARVVCAVDLSESSGETLDQAAAIAHAVGARLVVLYVAEGLHWYETETISGVDPQAVRTAVTKSVQERLAELIARHVPQGAAVDARVAFGRAQREIESVAREGADLVVLGASSSSGVDRFFFGSTAQHVLRAGVCPVLLVRRPASGAATA